MNKKSAADMLRDKYMATQLKKTAIEKVHSNLNDIYGIDYLKNEITSKLYNPIFRSDKYSELGTTPPKSVLIRGIQGVGKTFLINCFCQHYELPLITGFIESPKEIRELFSRSKTLEKSVILIDNVSFIIKEDNLMNQLNVSIRQMDWNSLVVLISTDLVEEINFENEIFLRIPTCSERKEILDGMLKNIKKENLDTFKISQNLPGFVGRDIQKLISMCCTRSVNRNCSNENFQNFLIMEDFMHCISNWKNITHIVTFDDIGALKDVKEELTMSILLPSRYPEKFTAFGISKPSGVLLFGPPGCGKTLIAKAVSNMSHCNFLSIKGPELITKYVGDSEKHLRDLFQKAKNLSPCVLFFDEIDSLCGRRGKNEFGNRIVNQILTLLDGMEDRGEVYIIGATNRIDSLDEALLRPGRFDKVIEVHLPSKIEALEIFQKCISNIPHEYFDFDILDFSNFSGADIAGVVKEAAIMCLKDNFEKENLKITADYFINAVNKMRMMKSNRRKVKKY